MRRILGFILAGLAGFFACTAVLLMVYAPGKTKVTPLNIDSTTRLSGTARALPTGGTGPIKAVNRTVADSAASDGKVAVFDTFTCLMTGTDGPDCVDDKDPQKRLISASTDRYATDRVSGLAVNDEKYTDQTEGPREGLLLKWPFDVQKQTYPYYDSAIKKAVDAVFQGEENLEGLLTYKYAVEIPETKIEIAKGVQGTYKDSKVIWVDQATGAPVKQTESQVRKLPDGKAVLDIDLAFTPEQVTKGVADAKKNGAQLSLLSKGPLFTGVIALLSAAGAFVALRGRRPEDEAATVADSADDPTLLDGFATPETRRRSDLNRE